MRLLIPFFALLALPLSASDLESLSNREVGQGLREALAQGVAKAVGSLSAADGFLGNPEVKIPLPPALARAERALRNLGMGRQADELVTTMNRAAESAVAEAKPILLDGVRKMTLADAKAILTGPEDSATRYFRNSSGEAIAKKFLPKVRAATARVKLAEDYGRFAAPAVRFGLLDPKEADLDQYIAEKAVDGLFLMIAKQEKAIRADPVAQGSKLLQRVFGSLRL
ncbi:MAG: DUF4197 domain-containing protein [Acidobacteria bacterium]|nr:DUF4197 domain-containing protein [Acidobacteriota bacterium]